MLVTVILAFSLCACTNSEAKVSENEGQAKTDIPETQIATSEPSTTIEPGIHEDYFIIGNYKFKIPDGYNAVEAEDNKNVVSLGPKNTDCVIQVYALDISFLEEKHLPEIFSKGKNSLDTGNYTVFNEHEMDGLLSGNDIKMRSYIRLKDDSNPSVCIDTLFTDSWYLYFVVMDMGDTSDNQKDIIIDFVNLTAFAEYLGESPRFDTVQYID